MDTCKMSLNLISVFFLGFYFTSALAQTPSPRSSAAASTPKTQSQKPAKSLWDHWYKITVAKRIPYAFYRETVEKVGDKLRFAVNMKKLEEGFFNEENMGAFAEDDQTLTPIFFNFRSLYRTTETVVDGTIGSDSVLSAKIRRNGQDLPVVKKQIPKGTMFSTFFPVWLGRNLKNMKPLSPYSFKTLLEDKPDSGFKLESGIARLEKEDAISKNTGTSKVTVDYLGNRSIWYVKSSGAAVRIEMPQQNITVDVTTQKEAESFLQK